MILWIGFIICSVAIVFSGIKLSKYGDIIAEKSGLGRTWIGVALMASVTSVPECVTGITSVVYTGVPDIAVGDILGSCVFNIFILAILDAIYRQMPITGKAHHGNILSASLGIFMLCVITSGIILGERIASFGRIGYYSLIIILFYFISMRLIYIYEKKQLSALVKRVAEDLISEQISLGSAILRYSINAAVIITAAVFLPGIGKGLAEATGLGQTFVGNTFIAISTSLPELVVSVAAVRLGAIDLAVGNLLGSNIFNSFMIAIDDIFFSKGPILSYVNPNHVISSLTAIMMTATAIIGLTYRAEKKKLCLSWDSIIIILLYVSNHTLLYLYK